MPRIINNDNRLVYRSRGILDRWIPSTFEQFTNDAEAKQFVLDYYNNFNNYRSKGIGLFVYGKNGVGKTHLLMCLCKKLIDTRINVAVVRLSSLVSMYSRSWRDGEAADSFDALYKSPTVLFIEEVGKEFKAGENDLGRTVLDIILRYRHQDLLPTFITTNFPPQQMKEMYSVDIASLMDESFITIHVQGESKRTIKL